MSTTTAFDIGRYTRAIEARDAATQLAMYAEHAVVTLADRTAPPGSPRVLRGKAEIGAWLDEVYSREMTHRVEHTVQDEAGAAFTQACRYPDGKGVLCACLLEIEGGLVTRGVGVQAWDE